jgi:hypothetical protein
MSADNWTICPRCKPLHDKRVADAQQAAFNAYGKVDPKEFFRLTEEAREIAHEDIPEDFREDYQCGLHGNEFTVDYGGRCIKCGLQFQFKHSEIIPVPPLKDAAAKEAANERE